MKKSRIEIFPLLDELCGGHTSPTNFHQDVWRIQESASEYEMTERTFYWLPAHHSGLCVSERNVFLCGTDDHRLWTSQHPEDGTAAYYIAITGGTPERPIGNIRSFDLSAHLRRLTGTAMEVKAVELAFYSGRVFSMEPEQYRADMERLFWEYGALRHIRYLPENEAKLTRTIMMEHRYQKGWQPKRDLSPPCPPSR